VDAEGAKAWMTGFAAAVAAHKDELTRLDSAIGDADHGANLDRGLTTAIDRLAGDTPGEVLRGVGRTLISTVGGASGPLYGSAFRALAKALGDAPEVPDAELAAGLRAAYDAIGKLGGAVEGDKTMLDAWGPGTTALEGTGDRAAAARAARAGAEATIPLQARKGRASYLGARSTGHQDPGATSTALLFESLAGARNAP
jgi:phosphoenolpyruvate---glycerone phosphotransferase subunit DhaL